MERDYDISKSNNVLRMNTDHRIQAIAKIAGIAKNLVIDLSGGSGFQSAIIRVDPR
jgi:hypothetical protein